MRADSLSVNVNGPLPPVRLKKRHASDRGSLKHRSNAAAGIAFFYALKQRTGYAHTDCHFLSGDFAIDPSRADYLPQQSDRFEAVTGVCAVQWLCQWSLLNH
jgi:hypothetical protein